MKKFKTILNTLLENEYVDVGTAFNGYSDAPPRSAHSDAGVYRDDSAQINRIHAFANSFLNGSFLEPAAALRLMRAKINHAGLDFDFNNTTELKPGFNSFQLNRFGEIFGTTPTTNLMNGFDRGKDMIPLSLTFNLEKSPNGKFYFNNVSITHSGMIDSVETKGPTQTVRESVQNHEMLLENKILNAAIEDPRTNNIIGAFAARLQTGKAKPANIHAMSAIVLKRLAEKGVIDSDSIDQIQPKFGKVLLAHARRMEPLEEK